MPGEKRKRKQSEHLPDPSRDAKTVKKRKKEKSGKEKKHKRKHVSDDLGVKESVDRPDHATEEVLEEKSAEKGNEKGRGNEFVKVDKALTESSPSKDRDKRKKKKKGKKERKADDLDDHISSEKQTNTKAESAEAVQRCDPEEISAAAEKSNDMELPDAESKRKKKKRASKNPNPRGVEDEKNQKNVLGSGVDVKKVSLVELAIKCEDEHGDRTQVTGETPKTYLVGEAKAENAEQQKNPETPSKEKRKKRKRERQSAELSFQRFAKHSDGKLGKPEGEGKPEKHVMRKQSANLTPANADDAKKTPLSGDEIIPSKATTHHAEGKSPSAGPSKEGFEEKSRDQEDDDTPLDDTPLDDTPLDDKRLLRTLFVGNVPRTANRPQLSKLFAEYGPIESIRLRNVVADNPKIPKKAALLGHRLASFSNSFSAYVVFKQVPNMDQVLQKAVNGTNMAIFQDHHLRVTKALQTRGRRRLSVFVGNLPFDCSDEEMITTFMPIAKECGVNLLNVRVTRDSDTGVGRGVGFATFDDVMGIQACMNKAGDIKLRGRVLRIERAEKTKMMKSKTYKRRKQKTFGRRRA